MTASERSRHYASMGARAGLERGWIARAGGSQAVPLDDVIRERVAEIGAVGATPMEAGFYAGAFRYAFSAALGGAQEVFFGSRPDGSDAITVRRGH